MNKTRKLTYTGIMTALVFLATYSIRIPVPVTNGYIHPGDAMVFLAAVILGWQYGVFAAGVGSMLADIIGGYPHWAVPTLIIKSVMALFIGIAMQLRSKSSRTIFAVSTALVWALFTTGMKRLLHFGVFEDAEALLKEVDIVNTISELEGLCRAVQIELSLSAMIIVLAVAGIGLYAHRKDKALDVSFILGITASGLWMVIAYYWAAYILYGNLAAPILSIPSNLVQFVAGFIIASAVYFPIRKYLITQ